MAIKDLALAVLPLLAVVAAWCAASVFDLVPGYLLPSPAAVFDAGWRYVWGPAGQGPYAGRFAGDLAASLSRVLLGFSLAVVVGIPLGICSGRLATVDRLAAGMVGGLRAVPGICWLPLALIWFGIGLKTTVFLVALAAFFPIYQNALTGARMAPPIYFQAGAMLGVSGARSVFAILLPLAMPNIVTGLRLGMGISWAYLVLGELTGVPDGLGAAIMDARMAGQTDLILAGIVLIALIGRGCDCLLVLLVRCLCKSARRQG
ncbi:ABC transporter permease [Desulfobulbus sp.]|uniref:ABC transporter permease n=1 Tax=Desulfobulbus sp. TaxID=895 RepID=UPI00286F439B|nr:ABC transporter permease [Desulfobulbus sp.]